LLRHALTRGAVALAQGTPREGSLVGWVILYLLPIMAEMYFLSFLSMQGFFAGTTHPTVALHWNALLLVILTI
jgi:hypothetical protein